VKREVLRLHIIVMSDLLELSNVKKALCDYSSDSKGFASAQAVLRALRLTNSSRPDVVLDAVPRVLKQSRKVGDEIWSVYEQYFLALLDVHDPENAKGVLLAMREEFPDSKRVSGLAQLYSEAFEAEDALAEAREESKSSVERVRHHVSAGHAPTYFICGRNYFAIGSLREEHLEGKKPWRNYLPT